MNAKKLKIKRLTKVAEPPAPVEYPYEPAVCPKCEGEMVRGFLLDHAGNYGRVPGVWTLDFRTAIKVAAYRCGRCGLVELYARDA